VQEKGCQGWGPRERHEPRNQNLNFKDWVRLDSEKLPFLTHSQLVVGGDHGREQETLMAHLVKSFRGLLNIKALLAEPGMSSG
jgi:hypothetical protein